MRRALIVGIDNYSFGRLAGCVNDARQLAALLERHENGDPNFDCKLLLAGSDTVDRPTLRQALRNLFAYPADLALFHFSGHGTVNDLGGYMVTQDAERYDDGVAMSEVLQLANDTSNVKEVVILLDCCHSGALGNIPHVNNQATLREGVTVLTASRSTQVSMEVNGGGVFTSLVRTALSGGAADVLGKVTVASVYAYVDQILGAWDQRPLFKAHVSCLTPLRLCSPIVPPSTLRLLPSLFPRTDYVFPLDPSYEPSADPVGHQNEDTFRKLQTLRDARLLVPHGAEHLYYAAMEGKACRLTPLGQYYRDLAAANRV
jgi:hypothetical protein